LSESDEFSGPASDTGPISKNIPQRAILTIRFARSGDITEDDAHSEVEPEEDADED